MFRCTIYNIFSLVKKTSELRIAEPHESRTILAPPFFHAMLDIAFNLSGKPHKKSRISVKIYALVIFCIMTAKFTQYVSIVHTVLCQLVSEIQGKYILLFILRLKQLRIFFWRNNIFPLKIINMFTRNMRHRLRPSF